MSHPTPQRLRRAMRNLLRLEPFWAMLVLRLDVVENRSMKYAMATNGAQLFHRPDMWKKYSDPELVWIMAHEVLHIIGAHHCRRQSRPEKAWNIAADYAVNDILIRRWGTQKFPTRVPEGILYNPAFSGWSAEAIYADLYKNPPRAQPKPAQGKPDKKKGQNGPPPPGKGGQPNPQSPPNGGAPQPSPDDAAAPFGYVLDAPSSPEQTERDLIGKLAEANTYATAAGMHVDGASRRALERAKVSTNWERHLAAYMFEAATRAGCHDYSWTRPQVYALQVHEVYIPSTVSSDPPPFTIAIDTSGSINKRQLAEMAEGVRGILSQWDNARADILYCDSTIKGRTVANGSAVNLEPIGGGGTLYGPVFDDNPYRELLIYFTDLYPFVWPPKPAYPVLWIYTGPGEIPPPVPYGKIVRLRTA